MSDRATAVIGLLIVGALILFIGSWFGWKRILWILIATIIAVFVGLWVDRLVNSDKSNSPE